MFRDSLYTVSHGTIPLRICEEGYYIKIFVVFVLQLLCHHNQHQQKVLNISHVHVLHMRRCISSLLSDAPCPEGQNINCPNNTRCYIYSMTGQSYCVGSCEINNGGCGTELCSMMTVQCNTTAEPCPPVILCRPNSK